MTNTKSKPVPRMSDATKDFWEGCKNDEIRIQKCLDCNTFRFPPQMMCRKCNSVESEWTKVSGEGAIYSFTMPTNQSPGEFPARGFEYPYSIALIELDGTDGVRIASNIVDCELADIRIGLRVKPHFVELTEEIDLPLYRLHETN